MNIFKSSEAMPPKDNSPDVVRTALTKPEAQQNLQPTCGYGSFLVGSSRDTMDVKSVQRPRFGHGY